MNSHSITGISNLVLRHASNLN